MVSLRMSTKDVIVAGLSFLVVIVALNILAGVLGGIGYFLFDIFSDQECNEWDCWSTGPSTASWIFGLLFWIPAGIILFFGWSGLTTNMLTDSIAFGVYKANSVGDDADLAVELPWGGDEQTPDEQPPDEQPEAVAVQQQPVVQQQPPPAQQQPPPAQQQPPPAKQQPPPAQQQPQPAQQYPPSN